MYESFHSVCNITLTALCSVLPRIGKGHDAACGKRALLRAELHFEGTFVRRIVIKENKAEKNYNFMGSIW